jgi:hypothetical protein
MTLLAIGRVFDGMDVAPARATWSGEALTLEGPVVASSVGALRACRDRLMSLVGSRDERHVPVTFSEDASWDGYYRPLAASMNLEEHHPTSAMGRWSVTLRPVGDGPLPMTEVKSMYGVVTNPWSITNSTLNGAYSLESTAPTTAFDHWNGEDPANGQSRTTETGTLRTFINQGGAPAAPSEVLHRYSVVPSDAYVGACSLRGTYAGVASALCLGRQMAPAASTFVLSNGLVRISVDSGSSRFAIQFYDPDSLTWVTVGPNTWGLTIAGSATTVSTTARISVLRNSPEQVSIRVLGPSTMGAYGPVWVDLSVLRGAPYVLGVVRTQGNTYTTIKPATGTACTSLDGGFHQTSNDAAGNRFVVTAGNNGGGTRNLVTGELGQSSAANRTFVFGVGVEIAGSGSVVNNTAQSIEYQMLSGRSETQRIVTR